MTKQEAYVLLREKLDAINTLVGEAQKFAHEEKLAMGQPRYKPHTFEAANPDQIVEDMYDQWIGSEVCW